MSGSETADVEMNGGNGTAPGSPVMVPETPPAKAAKGATKKAAAAVAVASPEEAAVATAVVNENGAQPVSKRAKAIAAAHEHLAGVGTVLERLWTFASPWGAIKMVTRGAEYKTAPVKVAGPLIEELRPRLVNDLSQGRFKCGGATQTATTMHLAGTCAHLVNAPAKQAGEPLFPAYRVEFIKLGHSARYSSDAHTGLHFFVASREETVVVIDHSFLSKTVTQLEPWCLYAVWLAPETRLRYFSKNELHLVYGIGQQFTFDTPLGLTVLSMLSSADDVVSGAAAKQKAAVAAAAAPAAKKEAKKKKPVEQKAEEKKEGEEQQEAAEGDDGTEHELVEGREGETEKVPKKRVPRPKPVSLEVQRAINETHTRLHMPAEPTLTAMEEWEAEHQTYMAADGTRQKVKHSSHSTRYVMLYAPAFRQFCAHLDTNPLEPLSLFEHVVQRFPNDREDPIPASFIRAVFETQKKSEEMSTGKTIEGVAKLLEAEFLMAVSDPVKLQGPYDSWVTNMRTPFPAQSVAAIAPALVAAVFFARQVCARVVVPPAALREDEVAQQAKNAEEEVRLRLQAWREAKLPPTTTRDFPLLAKFDEFVPSEETLVRAWMQGEISNAAELEAMCSSFREYAATKDVKCYAWRAYNFRRALLSALTQLTVLLKTRPLRFWGHYMTVFEHQLRMWGFPPGYKDLTPALVRVVETAVELVDEARAEAETKPRPKQAAAAKKPRVEASEQKQKQRLLTEMQVPSALKTDEQDMKQAPAMDKVVMAEAPEPQPTPSKPEAPPAAAAAAPVAAATFIATPSTSNARPAGSAFIATPSTSGPAQKKAPTPAPAPLPIKKGAPATSPEKPAPRAPSAPRRKVMEDEAEEEEEKKEKEKEKEKDDANVGEEQEPESEEPEVDTDDDKPGSLKNFVVSDAEDAEGSNAEYAPPRIGGRKRLVSAAREAEESSEEESASSPSEAEEAEEVNEVLRFGVEYDHKHKMYVFPTKIYHFDMGPTSTGMDIVHKLLDYQCPVRLAVWFKHFDADDKKLSNPIVALQVQLYGGATPDVKSTKKFPVYILHRKLIVEGNDIHIIMITPVYGEGSLTTGADGKSVYRITEAVWRDGTDKSVGQVVFVCATRRKELAAQIGRAFATPNCTWLSHVTKIMTVRDKK